MKHYEVEVIYEPERKVEYVNVEAPSPAVAEARAIRAWAWQRYGDAPSANPDDYIAYATHIPDLDVSVAPWNVPNRAPADALKAMRKALKTARSGLRRIIESPPAASLGYESERQRAETFAQETLAKIDTALKAP